MGYLRIDEGQNKYLTGSEWRALGTDDYYNAINKAQQSFKKSADQSTDRVMIYKSVLENPGRYNMTEEQAEDLPITATAVGAIKELEDIAYNRVYVGNIKEGMDPEKALKLSNDFLEETVGTLAQGGSGKIDDEESFAKLYRGLSFMFGRKQLEAYKMRPGFENLTETGQVGYILPKEVAERYHISNVGQTLREADVDIGSGTGQFFAQIGENSAIFETVFGLLAPKELKLSYQALKTKVGDQRLASKTAIHIGDAVGFAAILGEMALAGSVAGVYGPAALATLRGGTSDYFSSLGASRKYLPFGSGKEGKKHWADFMVSRGLDFGTYLASMGVSNAITMKATKAAAGKTFGRLFLDTYKSAEEVLSLGSLSATTLLTGVGDTTFDAVFDFGVYNAWLSTAGQETITLLDQRLFGLDILGNEPSIFGQKEDEAVERGALIPGLGSDANKFLRQLGMRLMFRFGSAIGKTASPFKSIDTRSMLSDEYIEKNTNVGNFFSKAIYKTMLRASPIHIRELDANLKTQGKKDGFLGLIRAENKTQKDYLTWHMVAANQLIHEAAHRTLSNFWSRIKNNMFQSGSNEYVEIKEALFSLKYLDVNAAVINKALRNEYRGVQVFGEDGRITEDGKKLVDTIASKLDDISTRDYDRETARKETRDEVQALLLTVADNLGGVKTDDDGKKIIEVHQGGKISQKFLNKIFLEFTKRSIDNEDSSQVQFVKELLMSIRKEPSAKALELYESKKSDYLNEFFSDIQDNRYYVVENDKLKTQEELLEDHRKLVRAEKEVRDRLKIKDEDMDPFLNVYSGHDVEAKLVSRALMDATEIVLKDINKDADYTKEVKVFSDTLYRKDGVLDQILDRIDATIELRDEDSRNPVMSKQKKFHVVQELFNKFLILDSAFSGKSKLDQVDDLGRRANTIHKKFMEEWGNDPDVGEIKLVKVLKKRWNKNIDKKEDEVTTKKVIEKLWDSNWRSAYIRLGTYSDLYYRPAGADPTEFANMLAREARADLKNKDFISEREAFTLGLTPEGNVVQGGDDTYVNFKINGKEATITPTDNVNQRALIIIGKPKNRGDRVVLASVFKLASVKAMEDGEINQKELQTEINRLLGKDNPVKIENVETTKNKLDQVVIKQLDIKVSEEYQGKDVLRLVDEAMRAKADRVIVDENSLSVRETTYDTKNAERMNEIEKKFKYFDGRKTFFDNVVNVLIASEDPTRVKQTIKRLLIHTNKNAYEYIGSEDARNNFIDYLYKKHVQQDKLSYTVEFSFEASKTLGRSVNLVPAKTPAVSARYGLQVYRIDDPGRKAGDVEEQDELVNKVLQEYNLVKWVDGGQSDSPLYLRLPEDATEQNKTVLNSIDEFSADRIRDDSETMSFKKWLNNTKNKNDDLKITEIDYSKPVKDNAPTILKRLIEYHIYVGSKGKEYDSQKPDEPIDYKEEAAIDVARIEEVVEKHEGNIEKLIKGLTKLENVDSDLLLYFVMEEAGSKTPTAKNLIQKIFDKPGNLGSKKKIADLKKRMGEERASLRKALEEGGEEGEALAKISRETLKELGAALEVLDKTTSREDYDKAINLIKETNTEIRRENRRFQKDLTEAEQQGKMLSTLKRMAEIDAASRGDLKESNLGMLDYKTQKAYEALQAMLKKDWKDTDLQKILQSAMFGSSALFFDKDIGKRVGIARLVDSEFTKKDGTLRDHLKQTIENKLGDGKMRIRIVSPAETKAGEEGMQGQHFMPKWLLTALGRQTAVNTYAHKLAYNRYGTMIKGIFDNNEVGGDRIAQGERVMTLMLPDIKRVSKDMRNFFKENTVKDVDGNEVIELDAKDFSKFMTGFKVHTNLVSSPNAKGLKVVLNNLNSAANGLINRQLRDDNSYKFKLDKFVEQAEDLLTYSNSSRYNSKIASLLQSSPRHAGTMGILRQKLIGLDPSKNDVIFKSKLVEKPAEGDEKTLPEAQQDNFKVVLSNHQLLQLFITNLRQRGKRSADYSDEVENAYKNLVKLEKNEGGEIDKFEEHVKVIREYLADPDKGAIVKAGDTYLAQVVRYPHYIKHANAPFIIEGVRRPGFHNGTESNLGVIRKIFGGDTDGDEIHILGMSKHNYDDAGFEERDVEFVNTASKVVYQWGKALAASDDIEDFSIKITPGTEAPLNERSRHNFVGVTTKNVQHIKMLSSFYRLHQRTTNLLTDEDLSKVLGNRFGKEYIDDKGNFKIPNWMQYDLRDMNFSADDSYIVYNTKSSFGNVYGDVFGSLRLRAKSESKELNGKTYKLFSFDSKGDKNIVVVAHKNETSGSYQVDYAGKSEAGTPGAIRIDRLINDKTKTKADIEANFSDSFDIIHGSPLTQGGGKQIASYRAIEEHMLSVGTTAAKDRTVEGLLQLFDKGDETSALNNLSKQHLLFLKRAFVGTAFRIDDISRKPYFSTSIIKRNDSVLDKGAADIASGKLKNRNKFLINSVVKKFASSSKEILTDSDIDVFKTFSSNNQPTNLEIMTRAYEIYKTKLSDIDTNKRYLDKIHPSIYYAIQKLKNIEKYYEGQSLAKKYANLEEDKEARRKLKRGSRTRVPILMAEEIDGEYYYVERAAKSIESFNNIFGRMVNNAVASKERIFGYLEMLDSRVKFGNLFKSTDDFAEVLNQRYHMNLNAKPDIGKEDFKIALNEMGLKLDKFDAPIQTDPFALFKLKNEAFTTGDIPKNINMESVRHQGIRDAKEAGDGSYITHEALYKKFAKFIFSQKGNGNEMKKRKDIVTTFINSLHKNSQETIVIRDDGINKEVADIISNGRRKANEMVYKYKTLINLDKKIKEANKGILDYNNLSTELLKRIEVKRYAIDNC